VCGLNFFIAPTQDIIIQYTLMKLFVITTQRGVSK